MIATRWLRAVLVVALVAVLLAVVWMLADPPTRATTRAPGAGSLPSETLEPTAAAIDEARAPTLTPVRDVEPEAPRTPISSALARSLAAADEPEFPGRFFLRVVDARTDGPIAGAHVNLSERREPSRLRIGHETDAEGWLELEAAANDDIEVAVRRSGFAPALLRSSFGAHSKQERALVVRLRPSAALEGTVLDAGGSPIAGQTVTASAESQDLTPARFLGEALGGSTCVGSAVTDEHGGFVLDDLPSSVQLLLVAEDERARSRLAPIRLLLDPGERRSMQWWERRAVRVTGRVVESDGSPCTEAIVRLEHVDDMPGGPPPLAVEDDGTFEFEPVQPGEWMVSARVTGHARFAEQIVTLAEGDEPKFLRLSLSVQTVRRGTLRGRVILPGGAPVPRAKVGLWQPGVWMSETECDDEGRFVLEEVVDFTGSVRASKNYDVMLGGLLAPGRGSQPPRIVHPVAAFGSVSFSRIPAEEIVVVLEPAGSVPIRVRDRDGRDVAGDVEVQASRRGGGGAAIARIDGESLLGPIHEGTFDVLARCNDGRIGVAEGVSVDLEDPRAIEVTVGEGAWLEVHVHPAGEPRRDGPTWLGLLLCRGPTAIVTLGVRPAGLTEVLVPAGPWRLELVDEMDRLAAVDVEAVAGATTRVDLRISR